MRAGTIYQQGSQGQKNKSFIVQHDALIFLHTPGNRADC